MRKPSLKTLKQWWSLDDAKIIRQALDACKYPRDAYEALKQINDGLKQFGVETIIDEETVLGEYVNTGDTYSSTIVYNHVAGNFISTCLGDYVEYLERRGYKDLKFA